MAHVRAWAPRRRAELRAVESDRNGVKVVSIWSHKMGK
jgi:hypothetical protein